MSTSQSGLSIVGVTSDSNPGVLHITLLAIAGLTPGLIIVMAIEFLMLIWFSGLVLGCIYTDHYERINTV